jgi:hypothetical protein
MTERGLFRNLEIIWDLGFGYWDFPARAGLGSGYAGLGGSCRAAEDQGIDRETGTRWP